MKNSINHIILYVISMIAVMQALEPVSLCAETRVNRMSRLQLALKDNPEDMDMLVEAGRTYLELYDYDGARHIAGLLEKLWCKNPENLKANFYSKLLSGSSDAMSGDSDGALSQLEQALMIADNKGLMLEQAMAYDAMAYCYINYEIDFGKGLECYKQALESARDASDDGFRVIVLNHIADAYLWRHDMSGLGFASEALSIAQDNNDEKGVQMSLLSIAQNKCGRNQPDDVPRLLRKVRSIQAKGGYLTDGEIEIAEARYFNTVNQYEKALQTIDNVLDAGLVSQSANLHLRLLLYKGWAQMSLKEYDAAIATLGEAQRIIEEKGFKSYILQVLSGTAYCHEQKEDYDAAFEYQKEYDMYLNMFWISEQLSRLHEYRVQNEVLLNESQIKRQKTELDARHRYIMVLVAIGIVLVMMICMLGYLYSRKQALVRSVVAREKESILREQMLQKSLDQVRRELAQANASDKNATISEGKIEDLMMRFNELMVDKHLYTDSGISLTSLAEMLGTNRTYLSQAINQTFGKSFPQVLAEYRVRASVKLLSDPDCDMPLKGIASQVGFSSPSVFFNTFRNIMGMTPAAYRNSRD